MRARLLPRERSGVSLPRPLNFSSSSSLASRRPPPLKPLPAGFPPRPSWISATAVLTRSPPSRCLDGLAREGVVVPLTDCPAVGVVLPTPLPRPENMRPNSILMPGLSPPGPICLGWAPCTAWGRGEFRPLRLSSGEEFSNDLLAETSLSLRCCCSRLIASMR